MDFNVVIDNTREDEARGIRGSGLLAFNCDFEICGWGLFFFLHPSVSLYWELLSILSMKIQGDIDLEEFFACDLLECAFGIIH